MVPSLHRQAPHQAHRQLPAASAQPPISMHQLAPTLHSRRPFAAHRPTARLWSAPKLASTTRVAEPALSRARPRTKDDLEDPVQIGAKGTSSSAVKNYPGEASLTQYMLLPVEQYFVLDPKQIRFLGGNRFLLLVPRITIFNVWLEPTVEVSVVTQANPPRVILQAENCRIKGSDLVERLKLDERFCMRFVTELTWVDDVNATASNSSSSSSSSSHQQSSSNSSNGSSSGSKAESYSSMMGSMDWPKLPSSLTRSATATTSAAAATAVPTTQGRIVGNADLAVWSVVIQPFNLMPREALVASCNVVMRGLIGTLLPMFVRDLAADYEKWAVDPAYRAARAARSKPLEVKL